MRYFVNSFFFLYFLEVRLSFLIRMGGTEAGETKGAFLPPLGTEDNIQFSIFFVLKIFTVFFSTRQYLYLLHS